MTQPKIEGVGHGIPRMLYASDGSNWYAILVDSDGHVKIDVISYPGSNALGNFPFGYYDRYAEQAVNLAASAGGNDLAATAVPAGEIWVVQAVNAYNINTNPTLIVISAVVGGYYIQLIRSTSPGANVRVGVICEIVMKAGDKVNAYFTGCTAGDDIYLEACGYKMKVA